MAIANTELMLNKMKCHALEVIRKVSCAASQQLRREFNVFAKSQPRNARRVHKEGIVNSPQFKFQVFANQSPVFPLNEWLRPWRGKKKKSLFLSQVVSFCSSSATNACLYLEVFSTGKHPGAPRRFWCSVGTTTTPQKGQEPQICALAGAFCLCHIYSWNIWSWSGELLPVWLQLVPNGTVSQGSVAAHFWNAILITNLTAASFSSGT